MKTCPNCGERFIPSNPKQVQRFCSKGCASTDRWTDAVPLELRRRVSNRTNYLIKIGKLKRQPCEVCGDTKVNAHHTDYTDPVKVRWLCSKHHKTQHLRS